MITKTKPTGECPTPTMEFLKTAYNNVHILNVNRRKIGQGSVTLFGDYRNRRSFAA